MAIVAASVAACGANTQVVHTWKQPNLTPQHFSKIIAVCICADRNVQRSVEDRLADHIKGATAAYTIIPDSMRQNVDAAKELIKQGGYDGAVVMQLIGVDKETTYEPGYAYTAPSAYGSMWGSWGYGYSSVYSPGYIREDQVVSFDTNVYAVSEGKLLWSSRTRTYNPESVGGLVDDIVVATVDEMKHQGVMAKK